MISRWASVAENTSGMIGARLTAPCPGPPAIKSTGSGAGAGLGERTIATASSMVLPVNGRRDSATVRYPQSIRTPSTAPIGQSDGTNGTFDRGTGPTEAAEAGASGRSASTTTNPSIAV